MLTKIESGRTLTCTLFRSGPNAGRFVSRVTPSNSARELDHDELPNYLWLGIALILTEQAHASNGALARLNPDALTSDEKAILKSWFNMLTSRPMGAYEKQFWVKSGHKLEQVLGEPVFAENYQFA